MIVTIEIISLLVLSFLIFLTIITQSTYLAMTSGTGYGFTNRESLPPNKGPFGFRIDNTLNNLKEGVAVYLPLVVVSSILGISNEWTQGSAWAMIIMRSLYVPIYFAGIQKLRTFVWNISFFSIPFYLYGILKEII